MARRSQYRSEGSPVKENRDERGSKAEAENRGKSRLIEPSDPVKTLTGAYRRGARAAPGGGKKKAATHE